MILSAAQERYVAMYRLYMQSTFDAELAWYMLQCFKGNAGQDSFSEVPNFVKAAEK